MAIQGINNYNIVSKIMNSPTKTALLIVRHPFERIVAAFRDKLERTQGSNRFFSETYGTEIVSKYRKLAQRKFGREHFDKKRNFGATLPVIPVRYHKKQHL